MTDMITVSRKEIDKLLTQLNITHQDLRALLDKAEVSEPVGYKVTGKLGERCSFKSSEVKKGDIIYTSPLDKAEVVSCEPVGEIKIFWGSDTGYEYGLTLIGGALGSQKEYDEWIVKNFNGEGIFKLYTSPPDQIAKIAELEAEIARLKAIIEDIKAINNVFGKGK